VDREGRLDLDALRQAVSDQTALVSVMLANNETGTVQPVAAAAELAQARGAFFHTDAAQALGKLDVNVSALGVHAMTIVGHKLYAPKGIGALYIRRDVHVPPLLRGGGQESGMRGGTENVPYVVGLGVACELAKKRFADDAARWLGLRETLFARVAARVPGLARNTAEAGSLPNTLSVRFPSVLGSAVLDGAPEVAASTGSACHEAGESASAVLRAMGLAEGDALGTVRLSLGRSTTERDVQVAADALVRSFLAVASRD